MIILEIPLPYDLPLSGLYSRVQLLYNSRDNTLILQVEEGSKELLVRVKGEEQGEGRSNTLVLCGLRKKPRTKGTSDTYLSPLIVLVH